MSSSESIEVSAPTVDQAISQALAQLGAEQDDVSIEVLSTPRAGVLGLGARQARVRVTRRAPEGASSGVMSPPPAPPLRPTAPPLRTATKASPRPAPARREDRSEPPRAEPRASRTQPRRETEAREDRGEGEAPARLDAEAEQEPAGVGEDSGAQERRIIDSAEQEREAIAILSKILELMGERAEIARADSDDPETLEINIKGDGSGILIGRHGQTLDALEYLVNRILARKIKDAAPISVDTESYRARRRGQLHRMALSKGEEAKREHIAVKLDPMPPRDRRIVHLALKDDPMITTRSSGEGFLRAIEIVPVDERRERGGGPSEGGRGRNRPRDRGREPEPPGQQGGFKHGQKRIV